MTYRQIVKAIGEELLDYLLASYPEGSEVKLTIDKYTFTQIYKDLGFTDRDVKTAFNIILTDTSSYPEALAVAVYQTLIAYKVQLSGYYGKLQETYKGILTDNNSCMRYFEAGQEKIWSNVRTYFRRNNRKFIIPASYSGPFRYVQYPYAQLVMSQSTLIKFADVFNQFLIPHKAYTLTAFNKIIKYSNYNIYNDFQMRLIYSFYLAWDGQTSADYKYHRNAKHGLDKQERNSFVIYTNDIDSTFILKKKITDMKYETIKNFQNIGNLHFFNFDDEYEDWLSCNRNVIDPETSNGILLNSQQYSREINKLAYSRAYKLAGTPFVFLSFDDTNAKNSFYTIFNIQITAELSSWLSGGIKLGKTRTYALNALPKLNFTNNESEIFINRQHFKFSSRNYILLNEFITNPGVYHIKLPNRPTTTITVETLQKCDFIPENAGWETSRINLVPSVSDRWNIRGKALSYSNAFLPDTEDYNCRPMIRHKEQFECRFDKFKDYKTRRF